MGYDVGSERIRVLLNLVGVVDGQPEVLMPPLRLIADVPYAYRDRPFHHAPQVWFDENTRREIHVLPHSQLHLLTSEILAENLPNRCGGDLEWEFDDPVNLDDRAKEIMRDFGGKVPKEPWEIRDGKVVLGRELAREKGEVKAEEVKSGEKP
ncbi:hypothetical protein FRC00_003297 [Tulasnella sp. 408]|nr:hypothetical protein FRC00_003297 [Tulasnella sp. 408]